MDGWFFVTGMEDAGIFSIARLISMHPRIECLHSADIVISCFFSVYPGDEAIIGIDETSPLDRTVSYTIKEGPHAGKTLSFDDRFPNLLSTATQMLELDNVFGTMRTRDRAVAIGRSMCEAVRSCIASNHASMFGDVSPTYGRWWGLTQEIFRNSSIIIVGGLDENTIEDVCTKQGLDEQAARDLVEDYYGRLPDRFGLNISLRNVIKNPFFEISTLLKSIGVDVDEYPMARAVQLVTEGRI